jgi:hypothetical protein
MEKPLLNNPSELPTDAVLQLVLGSAFQAYSTLMERTTELDLVPQWNYFKDGGAWLCKVQFKKKTVFWLSVWDNFFRVVFYFTEKTLVGMAELDIEPTLVQQLSQTAPIGKLIPMVFVVQSPEKLDDLLVVANYKKKLK